MLLNIKNILLDYKGFILSNVKREFQQKYQNSLLGAIWNVLNPLAMILIYTVIFSTIMRARLPGIDHSFAYSIYLCSGILTWGLFSEITTRGQNVFLENANLLKKISFPRICLPIIVVCNGLLNFSIIFSIFIAFLFISNLFPGIYFLAIFPVLLVLIIFAIGLGITLGIMNVFFRDVGYFFNIFIQFWFWFTPIVYVSSILPPWTLKYFALNPMFSVVGAFQTIFVMQAWPDWLSLLPTLLLGLFLCFMGMRLFKKHAGEMVDEL